VAVKIPCRGMKERFLVITTTSKKIVYLPVSRLLRIEATPARGPGTVPTVDVYFEGFQAILQISEERDAETEARSIYNKLLDFNDQDLVYLTPGDNITNIAVESI